MEFLIGFINDLATDLFYDKVYINGEDLFKSGGCYEFYKIIRHYVPSIELVIHKSIDHVAFLYNGDIYDASGKVDSSLYRKLTKEDVDYISEYFGNGVSNLHLSETILSEIKLCNIEDTIYQKLELEKEKIK